MISPVAHTELNVVCFKGFFAAFQCVFLTALSCLSNERFHPFGLPDRLVGERMAAGSRHLATFAHCVIFVIFFRKKKKNFRNIMTLLLP